jgi:hypothetical protein
LKEEETKRKQCADKRKKRKEEKEKQKAQLHASYIPY